MIPSSFDKERSFWLARHVLPHEPAMRAWLRRRVVDGLEVDDIVQETYAVLAAMESVKHIDKPRAYAFQTAHSLILRHVRRARVVRIDTVADIEPLRPVAEDPSPEHQVSDRQQLRHVLTIIDELPAKCRQAFTLRKFAGLSQRAVALQMGISESTVEKHIGRALRTLMDAMKDGEEVAPSDVDNDVTGPRARGLGGRC